MASLQWLGAPFWELDTSVNKADLLVFKELSPAEEAKSRQGAVLVSIVSDRS